MNNLDWCGFFTTASLQVRRAKSEEDLYRRLRKIKDDFNSEYGKLSRKKRNSNDFDEGEQK